MDASGNVLGTHPGIQYFSVGQRSGLGLNGNRSSPTYVIDIDAESNTVTVGAEEELLRTRLWASRMSFTSGSPPREPIELPAEIRYKASEAPATVSPDGEWLRIDFHNPSAR